MHRFTLFAAMAALILSGIATADAAPRKKPQASTDRSKAIAAQHRRHHVARPAAAPNQGWPTSWSDGSFSFRGN